MASNLSSVLVWHKEKKSTLEILIIYRKRNKMNKEKGERHAVMVFAGREKPLLF